jgi:hypothetical protein
VEDEMNKNMGVVDRGLRFSLAVVIAILYFTGTISGVVAAILGIVALSLLITSLVGNCPPYTLLGINTRKK